MRLWHLPVIACQCTPRVQLSVYNISATWRSELGYSENTFSRYLATGWTL